MNQKRNRLFGLSMAMLGGAVQLAYADPDRCLNCGWCSSSSAQCGMCIVEAVQRCCGQQHSGGAYAICDGGAWFAFCDGPGGSYVNCGGGGGC